MLSLHTNAASLSTQNSLGSTNKALSTSMTRLGTGLRVNSAMDDAAGLQIATRMNAQSRGMQVAQKNTQNGISMMQTAEGAMNEITNILVRMKDLATEAATASSSQADRVSMAAEFNELGAEMANIIKNTSFAGTKLFSDGSSGDVTAGASGLLSSTGLTFQIGSSSGETMVYDTKSTLQNMIGAFSGVTATYSGGTAASGVLGTTDGTTANQMIGTLESALDKVSSFRSQLGAASNRLEHVYNNLGNMIQNTEAAKGRIMDVDYATETSNMTSKQMLMQASTSMLKQSNSMSQMVASLLQ